LNVSYIGYVTHREITDTEPFKRERHANNEERKAHRKRKEKKCRERREKNAKIEERELQK